MGNLFLGIFWWKYKEVRGEFKILKDIKRLKNKCEIYSFFVYYFLLINY